MWLTTFVGIFQTLKVCGPVWKTDYDVSYYEELYYKLLS